jgi:AraC family L-rhamnose operon transcriptional activator RhaR/AraC family L-rhamnose operon regulatory protein RhaS
MYNYAQKYVKSVKMTFEEIEMQKLPNENKYFWSGKSTFRNDLDNVHIFVMKNYKIGMHIQEFFEINIITRGKGVHYIEENAVEASVGDVYIIPPMVRHGYTGGEGFDVFHVLLSDKFIGKNINELQMLPSFFMLFTAEPLLRAKNDDALRLQLTDEQFAEVEAMLYRALKYREYKDIFGEIYRSGFAIEFVSLLCKAYTENNKLNIRKNSDSLFVNAISYIHENYHKKITIDELAKISHLSRSSFVHKFKEICKMTPLEYITKRRIEASEYMLLNTKLSLSDVAFKCGFYDAAHFFRTFSACRGISPSVFRKNGGNGINQTSGS